MESLKTNCYVYACVIILYPRSLLQSLSKTNVCAFWFIDHQVMSTGSMTKGFFLCRTCFPTKCPTAIYFYVIFNGKGRIREKHNPSDYCSAVHKPPQFNMAWNCWDRMKLNETMAENGFRAKHNPWDYCSVVHRTPQFDMSYKGWDRMKLTEMRRQKWQKQNSYQHEKHTDTLIQKTKQNKTKKQQPGEVKGETDWNGKAEIAVRILVSMPSTQTYSSRPVLDFNKGRSRSLVVLTFCYSSAVPSTMVTPSVYEQQQQTKA